MILLMAEVEDLKESEVRQALRELCLRNQLLARWAE